MKAWKEIKAVVCVWGEADQLSVGMFIAAKGRLSCVLESWIGSWRGTSNRESRWMKRRGWRRRRGRKWLRGRERKEK